MIEGLHAAGKVILLGAHAVVYARPALARAAGSPGAKLTGAGGGGCVVSLPGPAPGAIMDAWTDAGFTCWDSVDLDDGGAL